MLKTILSKIVQNAQDKENLKFASYQANLKKINAGKLIQNKRSDSIAEIYARREKAQKALISLKEAELANNLHCD